MEESLALHLDIRLFNNALMLTKIVRRCNCECPTVAKASVTGTSQQKDLEVADIATGSKYVAYVRCG
jgi:hypothetical protein